MNSRRKKAIKTETATAKTLRERFLAQVDRVDEASGGQVGKLMGVSIRALQLWRAGSNPGAVAMAFVRVLDRIRRVIDLEELAADGGTVTLHEDVKDRVRASQRARLEAEFAARPRQEPPPPGAPSTAPGSVEPSPAKPSPEEELREIPAAGELARPPQQTPLRDPVAAGPGQYR